MHFNVIPVVRAGKIEYQDIIPLYLFEKGFFKVEGYTGALGNHRSQTIIAQRDKEDFEDGVYHCFPNDTSFHWNIKDFGPLYIPKAGDTIRLNQFNYILYKKYIEWEQQCDLNEINNRFHLILPVYGSIDFHTIQALPTIYSSGKSPQ